MTKVGLRAKKEVTGILEEEVQQLVHSVEKLAVESVSDADGRMLPDHMAEEGWCSGLWLFRFGAHLALSAALVHEPYPCRSCVLSQ